MSTLIKCKVFLIKTDNVFIIFENINLIVKYLYNPIVSKTAAITGLKNRDDNKLKHNLIQVL